MFPLFLKDSNGLVLFIAVYFFIPFDAVAYTVRFPSVSLFGHTQCCSHCIVLFSDHIQATEEEREIQCWGINQARKGGCFFQKVREYQKIYSISTFFMSKFLLQFVAVEHQHLVDQRVHP